MPYAERPQERFAMATYDDLPRDFVFTPRRGRRRSFLMLTVGLVLAAIVAVVLPILSVHASSPARLGVAHHGPTGGNVAAVSSPTPPASQSASPPTVGSGSTGELARLIAMGQPVYCGAPTKPLVALTFDDGPGTLTPSAMRTLKRNGNVNATFFLVGKLFSVPSFVDTAKRQAAAGMAFGDHTWDHVDVTKGNARLYWEQIARTRAVEERVIGRSVRFFRPPYGSHDDRLTEYVKSQGMLEIIWSLETGDAEGSTSKQIVRAVRNGLSAGDIVLLHDNRGTTEKALPQILDIVRQRGLTPVTLPQLLRRDPPTNDQLRRHSCG